MISQIDVLVGSVIKDSDDQFRLILNLKGIVMAIEGENIDPSLKRELKIFELDLSEEKILKEKIRHLKRVIRSLEGMLEVKE